MFLSKIYGKIKAREAVMFLVASVAFISCSQEKEHTAPAIHDKDSVSVMKSFGVNTLVSDSGIIKYRIVAESWDINQIRKPTRWTFIKGLFMEQFDEKFNVQAYIQADTAWYYDQLKLWELRGRVRIRNINGMVFRSEELFWDGIKHELYSFKFSRMVTPERTLEGTYFRSDEKMTHYVITNSAGSFVKSDMEPDQGEPLPADTTSADSLSTAPPPRQAQTPRAATTPR